MCIINGCKKIPCFNYENETKAIYCLEHKLNNMIDIKNRHCNYNGCKKQPSFNYENETKAIYCSEHKLNEMVNVIEKRKCNYNGCKKQPSFNYENETKAIYCSEHKLNNMINVVSKTCNYNGCKKNPCFNYENETIAIYCATHKKEGMVDVINKTCKSEWCSTQPSNKKYEGYCLYCYINLFPNKPITRNYKTKEYSVVDFIKKEYPNLDWIADKIINGGCSKKRPDLFLDLGYQIIIIEIDENQHTDYDCSCENKRLMQLSLDVNHTPIIFIRFNPDDYIDNNKNISSCWGINGHGICDIKKTKKKEWNERLNLLKEHIEYWINPENTIEKTIEIIQLFYDR